MNQSRRIALLGMIVLSVLLMGGMLALRSAGSALAQAAATPTSAPQQPAVGADSATPATDTASGVSVAQVWDKFCVAKIPYTLLALPTDASFTVKQPTGLLPTPIPGYTSADQIACNAVGTFRGKQVIVCRGPQLYAFTLQISGGGASQDFQVPLKDCALPQSAKPANRP